MLFNSIDFAIFLPIVFALYWFVMSKNLKLQNALIVAASYLFYGWWDYRFLSLIILSTVLDFVIGQRLKKEEDNKKRKILLWTSVAVNLGSLGFFKYFNFFIENFVAAFTLFGSDLHINTLNIILPVGISFYTFQTLSYTIDVYKKKLEPTDDFVAFSAFVIFFPQLVSGPIERASNLLPQFYKKREFNYAQAVDGTRQILWGLFKKIVIADNCAVYANQIYNNSADLTGLELFLGPVFFAFQIYGDFSGYSDIAIGTSRLFGFNLMQNFAFPYFARDIAEFWRRWHISLSTYIRDYLYIPIGGSRGNTWFKIRNTYIIFIVSGFWHGAEWTYVLWGAFNATMFLPLMLTNNNRAHIEITGKGKIFAPIKDVVLIVVNFVLNLVAWILFRSETIGQAGQYLLDIFKDLDSYLVFATYWQYKTVWALIAFFTVIEWFGREGQFGIGNIDAVKSRPLRWAFYLLLCLLIFLYQGEQQTFIYFQF